MTDPTEQESSEKLFAKYLHGDDAALEELRKRHDDELRRHLIKNGARPPIDVEDVLQDTWVKVIEKRDRFVPGKFIAWACVIGVRTLADSRKKKRPSATGQHFIFDDYLTFDPIHEDSDGEAALKHCVEKLGEKLRRVILGILSGRSAKAIADELQIQSDMVHRRAHRARQQLKECIQRQLSAG